MAKYTGPGPSESGLVLWPSSPPKDLALQLADALQYPNCKPEDLWDEIGGWLNEMQVAPPEFQPSDLVLITETSLGHRKFRSMSQLGSEMSLTRLIYASHHHGLDAEAFEAIRSESYENNTRDRITGVLVISENGFLQLLEGSRRAIGQCFVRIMKDSRHDDIQIVSCRDVSQRLFQEWAMHLISTSKIKEDIMSRYLVDGAFRPALMSEFAIEDLCRTLSDGNWESEAAQLFDRP